VQLEHTILAFETAVENQLRVAGPEAAEIGEHLMAALKPAIRQALMESRAHGPGRSDHPTFSATPAGGRGR